MNRGRNSCRSPVFTRTGHTASLATRVRQRTCGPPPRQSMTRWLVRPLRGGVAISRAASGTNGAKRTRRCDTNRAVRHGPSRARRTEPCGTDRTVRDHRAVRNGPSRPRRTEPCTCRYRLSSQAPNLSHSPLRDPPASAPRRAAPPAHFFSPSPSRTAAPGRPRSLCPVSSRAPSLPSATATRRELGRHPTRDLSQSAGPAEPW